MKTVIAVGEVVESGSPEVRGRVIGYGTAYVTSTSGQHGFPVTGYFVDWQWRGMEVLRPPAPESCTR